MQQIVMALKLSPEEPTCNILNISFLSSTATLNHLCVSPLIPY